MSDQYSIPENTKLRPVFSDSVLSRHNIMSLVMVLIVAFAIIWPEYLAFIEKKIVPSEALALWINNGIASFVSFAKPTLRTMAEGINWCVRSLQSILHFLPWFGIVVLITLLSYRLKSYGLALLCGISVLYMALSGHWIKSMNTLAMVGVSVPMALGLGFALGVFGAKSNRAHRIIMPILDLMQTIPTFAYLTPLVFLFGFGPVPGVLASMIYAAPPITRNVILGLKQVPTSLHEVASMSGATPLQRFWNIELPCAKHQILIGINQTVLASLSMVIIAAVIGGFDDIGREVLVATNKGSARFGQALGAGIVIVLLAIVIDRMTRAAAERNDKKRLQKRDYLRDIGVVIAAMFLGWFMSDHFTALEAMTAEFLRGFEANINAGLNGFITDFGKTLDQIKNNALVYILLPMRIGLSKAVLPFTWGFSFPEHIQNIYLISVVVISSIMILRGKKSLGFMILGFGLVAYRGFTFLPWVAVVVFITWLCYRFQGVKFAIAAFLMMLVMTWAGHWQDAMYSVYLCTASVLVCVVIGCPLGIWAAKSATVSKIMHPINDTLQSIPLYIFLIPAVALFQINEFSALVAIVLYAIVPLIRYTEHGLRHVPETVLEAATAQGCSKFQKLIFIELPMARPTILLGLNQTVLFALAMLIIAVLVGARGLAEQVNIGLRDANTGLSLTAGFSMAFIAIIADRILRGWATSLGGQDDV